MKRIGTRGALLLLLFTALFCFASCDAVTGSGDPVSLAAAAGTPLHEGTTADGATWKIFADGSLTVDGQVNAMYDYDFTGETPPWRLYADEVTSIIFGEGVHDISEGAFSGMKNVIWVDFGGVKTVGYSAFENCVNLRRVVTPETLTEIRDDAFRGCYRLREVTLTGVTKLGSGAFSDCLSLVTVKQPAALTDYESAYLGSDQIVEIVTNGERAVITDENGFLLFGSTLVGYDGRSTQITLPDTIQVIAPYAFYANTSLETVTIPSSVVKISEGAFKNCSSLKTLTVGEGVASIGTDAFAGLSALETLSFQPLSCRSYPDGAGLFEGLPSLRTLTFGDGVTTLQAGMFRSCGALEAVKLPAALKTVPESLFESCRSLSGVTFGDAVTIIGESAFSGCVSLREADLPESVTTIRANAFRYCGLIRVKLLGVRTLQAGAFFGCGSLTGVILGKSVTVIGDSAFGGCYRLVDIINLGGKNVTPGKKTYGAIAYYTDFAPATSGEDFRLLAQGDFLFMTDPADANAVYLVSYVGDGETVTLPASFQGKSYMIHQNAFRGNSTMREVVLSAGVTGIGANAFRDCLALTTVSGAASSMTAIGNEAFLGCTALVSVTLPETLASIGEAAFSGCSFLGVVTVPDGVTTLGGSVFQESGVTALTVGRGVTVIPTRFAAGCERLTSVSFSGNVSEIGDYAFLGCARLEDLTLPDTLQTIGSYAFFDDTRLLTLVLPDSLTAIGARAFENCARLVSVTVGRGLTTVGAYAFRGCRNLYEIVDTGNAHLTLEAGKIAYGGLTENAAVIAAETSIVTDGDYLWMTQGSKRYLLGYTGAETTLTLPASYVSGGSYVIAPYAFANAAVTDVTLGSSVSRIGVNAFEGSALEKITLNASLTAIGSHAFAYTPLREVVFQGYQCKTIGDAAFRGCENLITLDIWGAQATLGFACFADCVSLTEVTFSSAPGATQNFAVSSVGAYCFENCISLTHLTFPYSVTSFGKYWYAGCRNLQEIINPSTASIGDLNNTNSVVKNKNTLPSSTKITVKDGFLFYDGRTLVGYVGDATDLVLPEISGGYAIGAYAFWGRTELTSIKIAASVTSIGDYAFAGCTSLTSVYLSGSTLIGQAGVGKYLFWGCSEDLAIGVDIASEDALPKTWNTDWCTREVVRGHEFRVNDPKWADVNAGQSYASSRYLVNWGLSYDAFLAMVDANA